MQNETITNIETIQSIDIYVRIRIGSGKPLMVSYMVFALLGCACLVESVDFDITIELIDNLTLTVL